jgi:photosystem II stability/assembly factor-like uncharacterized protein
MIYFGLVLPFFFSTSVSAQWTWQSPLPQGNLLRSICFPDDLTGYAAGDAGTILKTDDGGETWSVLDNVGGLDIFSMDFIDAQHGILVGESGMIARTSDGGSTWSYPASGTQASLNAVEMIDQFTAVAIGRDSLMVRTEDGGDTWNFVEIDPPCDFLSFKFLTPMHAILLGYDLNRFVAIFHSVDGGLTWSYSNPGIGQIFRLVSSFPDEMNGFMSVNDYGLYKTTDGGYNWTPVNSSHEDLNALVFADPVHGKSLKGGLIYTTQDSGVSWQTDELPAGYSLFTLASNPSGKFFTAGYAGCILGKDDQEWAIRAGGKDINYEFLHINPEGSGLIIGNGFVMHSGDFGQSWDVTEEPLLGGFYAASFYGADIGFALVSQLGNVVRTDDGGYTWVECTKAVTDRAMAFTDIGMSDATHGFIVGASISPGGITDPEARRTTDGLTWHNASIPLATGMFYRVKFFSSEVGYILGSVGQVLKTTDGGDYWDRVNLTEGYSFMDIDFASETRGCICFGRWNSPTLGVFITNDGGESWNLAYSEPNIKAAQFTKIAFADSLNGYIIGSDGILRKTGDGGLTWQTEIYTGNSLFDIFLKDDGNAMIVGGSSTILTLGSFADLPDLTGGDEDVEVIVYPNPSTCNPDIAYLVNTSGAVNITVSSITGQVIWHQSDPFPAKGKHRLQMGDLYLPNGIYFITISQGQATATKKFVMAR